ncbi:tetratricopeptide repeat protein [Nonomuraea bangladeshensis]|uniref:tetratricopeptide repeat protein n=1 Tax=Nonomuraea bangladeshensis TaxID=404385 RepID=UPI003C2AF035
MTTQRRPGPWPTSFLTAPRPASLATCGRSPPSGGRGRALGAGLYPSLHLNLTECYRKLGDLDRAREHLRQARAEIGRLGDDDYGRLIRGGLERLEQQLGEADDRAAPPCPP